MELIIGREGEQKQTISDMTVSGKHMALSYSEIAELPYRVKLLKIENSLIVDNIEVVEIFCGSNAEILLGKNRFRLDLHSAIKDLECKLNMRECIADSINKNDGDSNPYSDIRCLKETEKVSENNSGDDDVNLKDKGMNDDDVKEDSLEQLDNMRHWYENYEKLTHKDMMQRLAVRLTSLLPIILFAVSRMYRSFGGAPAWLLLLTLVALAVACILNVWYPIYAKNRAAAFKAMMRNNYACPAYKGRPLYMDKGMGVYIPFKELHNGKNCELCCYNSCKQHK